MESQATEKLQLNHPWLVAIWPAMGHVAFNAGVYLLAKLGMTAVVELEAGNFFDAEQVEVQDGLLQPIKRPRSRFFVWTDPQKKHDLVLFLGEAQPPLGKYPFCRMIIDYAKELGVERVFTFAAMATQMHPEKPSRIFGAASDPDSLEELKCLEVELVASGNISGLNGVLLGVAAEAGLRGTCLLGEMPHIFAQLPFPKASLAILEVFTTIARIDVDFTQLAEQAKEMEQQLGVLLARVEESLGQQYPAEAEEFRPEPIEEEKLGDTDKERLEDLFTQAAQDKAKAFDLKRELDRLGVFKEYEDRFLDLFKKPS